MKIQVLSEKYNDMVRKDDDLMLSIAKANDVRTASVLRWLTYNTQQITTVTNLDIIRKHFNLPKNERLTVEHDILV